MKTAAKPAIDNTQIIHMLPRWVTSENGQGTDSVVFTSGAALPMLDVVLRDPSGTLPGALLRKRLALRAAVYGCTIEGRGDGGQHQRCHHLTVLGDVLDHNRDMLAGWVAAAVLDRIVHDAYRNTMQRAKGGRILQNAQMRGSKRVELLRI